MKKILVFIKNEKNQLLALKGSDKDPQFHESFWYTVTGAKEEIDKTLIETVKRELKEETNLEAKAILYLNWILKYESLQQYCEEYVYICEVKEDRNIVLNEENLDYKYLTLKEFIDKIKWYGDKTVLEKVLDKALKWENYFAQETITEM